MAKAKKSKTVEINRFPCFKCKFAPRDGSEFKCVENRPEFWSSIQGFSENDKGLPLKICTIYEEAEQ